MLYICSVKPINNTRYESKELQQERDFQDGLALLPQAFRLHDLWRLPPLGMEEGLGESPQDQCRCIRLRHRPQGEILLEEVRRAEPHGLRQGSLRQERLGSRLWPPIRSLRCVNTLSSITSSWYVSTEDV